MTITVPGYEVETLLGKGGMGVVYRALTPAGAAVAVKVLLDVEVGSSARLRFEREARAMRQVEHPNVCAALDFGELHGEHAGGLFLTMELLDGEDLQARLDRQGTLAPLEAVRIAREAAEGLARAHSLGIVHRDVKPSNLFLHRVAGDEPGREVTPEATREVTKVVDFGLAVLAAGSEARLTRTGDVLGTPAYMSPEQARGDRTEGAPSDVFSLGAVLYHCLTGGPPFGCDAPLAVIVRMLTETHTSLRECRPDLPGALTALVDQMLSRDRADRPPSMAAVASALGRAEALLSSGGGDETVAGGGLDLTMDAALGTALAMGGTVAAPAGGTALGVEQRLITALFAEDVADPNPVVEAIRSHGGQATVIGKKGVVGLFGATEAEGDEVDRAVMAGLACQPHCSVVGVGTGRAIQGQGDVSGAALETAFRAARDAEAGVRVDPAIQSRLSGRFRMADGRVLDVIREPVDERLPLFGRDADRAGIQALVERVSEDDEAAGLLVLGPPGVGKSRLIDEVLAAAREDDDALQVLSGRGDPSRRFTGWHAIGSAIRGFLELDEDVDPEVGRERLEAAAGDVGESCVAFLSAALGIAPPDGVWPVLDTARQDPRVMRDQIVNAIGEWLEWLCEDGPVVLVIRDVQWADAPSLELVDVLFRRLEEAPLMVLLTGRPHAVEDRPELFDIALLEHRELKELTGKASRRLLRAVMDDRGLEVDDTLLDQLVEHTGGNPFFLTEVARYVADRLESHGLDGFDPAAYALPMTVEAAVQSRLDHLDRADKDLIKRASVLGDRFWREALSPLGCPEPAASLTRLERNNLVRRPRRRDIQLKDYDEYAFRQRVVREVAYLMLTDGQRRQLHACAGQWMREVPAARPEIVAAHLEDGGDTLAAGPLWIQAAEQAEREGDIRAAFERWQKALSDGGQLPDPARRNALVGTLRTSHFLGEYQRALPFVFELQERVGERDVEAIYWLGLLSRFKPGDHVAALEESVTLLSRAAEVATDSAWQATSLARLAVAELRQGSPNAVPTAKRSVELAGEDPAVALQAWDALAMANMYSGRLTDAAVASRRALAYAHEAGNIGFQVSVQTDIAYVAGRLGNLKEAEEMLRAAIVGQRTVGRRVQEGYARHNLGFVLHQLGAFEDAIEQQRLALAIANEQSDQGLAGSAETYLALHLPVLRRHGEAVAAGQRALELTESTGHEVLALVGLATALFGSGETEKAWNLVRRIEELKQGAPMLELQEEFHLVKVRSLTSLGRDSEAREAARTALVWLDGEADKLGLEGAERECFLTGSLARTALRELGTS